MKEQVFTFAPSLEKFMMKTKVSIDNRRIVVSEAHSLFGIIPVGRTQQAFPLRNISSVIEQRCISWGRVGIGIGLGLCTLAVGLNDMGMGGDSGEGMVAFFLAMIFFLYGMTGIGRRLVIISSGSRHYLSFPWYTFGTMSKIRKCISSGMNYEADKTDLNLHDQRMMAMMSELMNSR